MKFHSKIKKIWDVINRFLKILMTARISLIMVILSAILFFGVSQIKDAIIALGNFAALYQFIITSIAGFVLAFFIWYWARVFYYLDYWPEALQPWEKAIVVHTPRILGGTALVIFGIAFLSNGISLYHVSQTGGIQLILLGCVFFIYTILFLFFVYFRRKMYHLQTEFIHLKHDTEDEFLSFSRLPLVTRLILITSTVFYLILLFLFIISPIKFTIFIGDGVTTLFLCLGIWLPVCYWILMGSKRTGLPLYLFLFIIIAAFSLFNSNKNVRIMNNPDEPVKRTQTLYEYFEKWYTARQSEEQKDTRLPLVLILSEGGGIRASYWGAGLLSALHEKHTLFSEFVFGIYGISGGTFSGTVFDTLIKFDKDFQDFYDKIPEQMKKKHNLSKDSIIRYLSNDIIGKDYLSPVIAAMFTSEIVQMILPFPVTQFDYAKVFEKTWEYHWNNAFYKLGVSLSKNTVSFASPFMSIWAGDSNYEIPRLFIGITRVEDGSPYLISTINLNDTDSGIPHSGITKDFYWFTRDL
ncbi:MAG: hypothetical protein JXJ04_22675, partial [Spirochaetales bacterium]|nr:hypothetical protein [Spirochaetales bacterium]